MTHITNLSIGTGLCVLGLGLYAAASDKNLKTLKSKVITACRFLFVQTPIGFGIASYGTLYALGYLEPIINVTKKLCEKTTETLLSPSLHEMLAIATGTAILGFGVLSVLLKNPSQSREET